ncbi:MAG: hypothetical protein FWF68_09110 [Spirochaetes bacterium]|nr:hypothetical protein [Spirochaetota bacterium]
MKITKIILAFFVCFAFGSCASTKVERDTEVKENTEVNEVKEIKETSVVKEVYVVKEVIVNSPHRIEVDSNLLKNIKQKEIESLFFYISADQEFLRDNTQNLYSVGSDGIYYTNTVHESRPVIIKNDDQLIFAQNIRNWERVEVKLKSNEDIRLIFARISNTNKYELVSAREGTTQLGLPSYEKQRPLLQIMHVSGPNPNPSDIPQGENNTTINDVLGTGRLTVNDIGFIADFICSQRKPNRIPSMAAGSGFDRSSVVEIIEFYFKEAEQEGINPDLAIAQVMHNLQYFSESKKYKDFRQAHNYGRLIIAKNIRNSYWDGKSFTGRNISERRRIGIRAHIQFLKRSASGALNSERTPIVLPTWNALKDVAGTRKTLEDISRSWGGLKYANNVRDKYKKLWDYVSARRKA